MFSKLFNLLRWIDSKLKAIGKWKSSQGPEADGLHTLISYAVMLTIPSLTHLNVWVVAAGMFGIAILLEVYDHFYEPAHPISDDVIDVVFYTLGIFAGLIVCYGLGKA